MHSQIHSNHYFLTINEEIRTICKPLFTYFGMTSFVYAVIYSDGSDIKLGTDPKWIEFFYNQHLYKLSQLENKPYFYIDGFVLWSQLTNHQVILKYARDYFNIDHGVTYIRKSPENIELFFFGTERDNSNIIHYYINNLDLLKKFSQYFVTTAKAIIDRANKNRIFIPNKFDTIIVEPKIHNFSDVKYDFLKAIQLQSEHTLDELNVTSREWQVCLKLIEGKTAKEIANELLISSRTAETHLANIKEKLHCYSKSELIKKLRSFNLDKLY